MENCKSKTINEAIELLSSLENSSTRSNVSSKVNSTNDVNVESILNYLDKSKEIISKFKDLDAGDGGGSNLLKGWWRKFLGHIVKAVGDFLSNLGEGMINETP